MRCAAGRYAAGSGGSSRGGLRAGEGWAAFHYPLLLLLFEIEGTSFNAHTRDLMYFL